MGRLIATLLLLGLALPATADDHALARELREAGQIVPLQDLLGTLPADTRVLEVELEHDDNRYVYEIEVLDAAGEVREYQFDARTGERLKVEKEN